MIFPYLFLDTAVNKDKKHPKKALHPNRWGGSQQVTSADLMTSSSSASAELAPGEGDEQTHMRDRITKTSLNKKDRHPKKESLNEKEGNS